MYAFCSCSIGDIGPVESAGSGRLDQVVPELVSGQESPPSAPAAPLRRAAVVGPVLLRVARLLDQVARHGDGVANTADVTEAGAKPLVVVRVVVNLERHHPVADHVSMVDAGRAFLLIGGVGISLQPRVGVARHVPGVRDPGRGLGVKCGRFLGADRLDSIPQVNAVMVRARMHRLDLHDRVEQRVDRLPAADPVHGVLPGHHGQPGTSVDVAGKLLDDRLEALQPVLPLALGVRTLLEKRLQGFQIK